MSSCGVTSSSAVSCTPRKGALMFDEYDPCLEYSKDDSCVLYEGNTVAESLTEEPNGDDPLAGSLKNPPTWQLRSACYFMRRSDVSFDEATKEWVWTSADGRKVVRWGLCSMFATAEDNGNYIGG